MINKIKFYIQNNLYQTCMMLICLVCIKLLGFGYYLQYAKHIEPCPLCITQRFIFFIIALTAGVGIFTRKSQMMSKIIAWLLLLFAVFGFCIAARHVWIQHLPPNLVPACGPGLAYMLEVFPFLDTLKALLTGDGNCAEVTWTFLRLSIPEWSLVSFSFIMAITMYAKRKI